MTKSMKVRESVGRSQTWWPQAKIKVLSAGLCFCLQALGRRGRERRLSLLSQFGVGRTRFCVVVGLSSQFPRWLPAGAALT